MKKLINSIAFLMAVVVFGSMPQSVNALPSIGVDDDAYVILPAGTYMSLELNQEVSSELFEIGNTIEFMVRNDVRVNGEVLIRAGSMAERKVLKVDKFLNACSACDGTCSKITVIVESVCTVDGQTVLLNSTPLIKRGGCAGVGSVTLDIRTRIPLKLVFQFFPTSSIQG